jgi:type IV pilus assembly protein PilA
MIKVNRNSKGFTLIELLIVIAIIGILAAIAIPAYSGYTKKSKMAGVISAMGAIKNAVVAYYTEAGNVSQQTVNTSALVGSIYGVTPPDQYISAAAVDTAGVITLTIQNIGADLNTTTLVLTPDWSTGRWTWSGTAPAAYIPKS